MVDFDRNMKKVSRCQVLITLDCDGPEISSIMYILLRKFIWTLYIVLFLYTK
jgi:hypothetical protein